MQSTAIAAFDHFCRLSYSRIFACLTCLLQSQTPPVAGAKGILLVEEYDALAIAISAALKKFAPAHDVRVARSLAAAEEAAAELQPELFVVDLDPPPVGDVEFFGKLQDRYPEARVLVVAAGTSPELRTERGPAGAVQFIEKPFDLGEFGAAVQALLGPWAVPPTDHFRGTLRDLHVVDIVQLKSLSLSTVIVHLETTEGQTGEIHFRKGEIWHATTGELIGVPAFEEIVSWPGGKFSETEMPENGPHSVDAPWAVLLLQAVRRATERAAQRPPALTPAPPPPPEKSGKSILVIDDTEMLLIFAADVLETADGTLEITTASTGREGLKLAAELRPDLILLDYSLTDTTGAEVCRGLLGNEATACIPVLLMSGHLPELANTAARYGNVVATLPKPFLSGALIQSVEKLLEAGPLPKAPALPLDEKPATPASPAPVPAPRAEPEPAPRPPAGKPILPNGHGNGHATANPAPAPPLSPSPFLALSKTALPAAEAGTDVSVTFSLEVAAMQLTPSFQMASLHLKPAEAAVAVRVADGGALGMLVETGFRMGPAQLSAHGRLGTILLFPTQKPPGLSPGQNSFMVNTVRTEQADQKRVVELTAAKSEAMRVRLTAQFEFVRVELSPTFDVVAVVLRARDTAVQIGTGESDATAPFELVETQLAASGQLSELFVRALR